MEKLLCLLLILTFLTCTNYIDPELKNYKNVHIKITGRNLYIPKSHIKASIPKFQQKLNNLKKQNEFTYSLIKWINNLGNLSPESLIFHDSTDVENTIWIQKGEYVNFDQELANQFSNMLESKMRKEIQSYNFKTTLIDSKYFIADKAKVLKVKFKLESENHTKYFTQYVISSYMNSFSFVVINYSPEDLEKVIRRL